MKYSVKFEGGMAQITVTGSIPFDEPPFKAMPLPPEARGESPISARLTPLLREVLDELLFPNRTDIGHKD